MILYNLIPNMFPRHICDSTAAIDPFMHEQLPALMSNGHAIGDVTMDIDAVVDHLKADDLVDGWSISNNTVFPISIIFFYLRSLFLTSFIVSDLDPELTPIDDMYYSLEYDQEAFERHNKIQ
ncbi:hypothetical protein HK096_008053, partial [Nowakowskiella sp. JEL0078]